METERVLESIRRQRNTFSVKERVIADFILRNPAEAVDPGIADLSRRIGISESTMVRFARKLGFSGYQQFRIALARETIPPLRQVFETDLDERHAAIDTVFRFTEATIDETYRHLDRTILSAVADRIVASHVLYLAGLGGSNIVALDAYHKLMRIGIVCNHAQDFHMQLMLASQATAGDLAFLVSHTGIDNDAIALASEYHSHGCPVVVLTSHVGTSLAAYGDMVLSIAVPKSRSTVVAESFSSRTAAMVVVDTLYVEVLERLGNTGLARVNTMRNAIAGRRE